MALRDLVRLIPPPVEPRLTSEAQDWNAVEQALGTQLPADYRQLIQAYGAGTFCRTIEIFGPFGRSGLKAQQEARREYFTTMAGSFPEPQVVPRFQVYPERGGILVVGGDELMGFLTWLTQGPPDEWPLIWFDDYMTDEERFEMRLTDFLVEWAAGRLTPRPHTGRFELPPLQRGPLFVPKS